MQSTALERVVGNSDFRLEVAWEFGGQNGVTDLCAALAEIFHVPGVEILQDVANLPVQPRLAQEVTIRLGGDGKAIRHLHALGRQLAKHLAQRRVLAANERHIVDADVGEPFDEVPWGTGGCFRFWGASGRTRHGESRRPWRRFGFRGIRLGCHKLSSFVEKILRTNAAGFPRVGEVRLFFGDRRARAVALNP